MHTTVRRLATSFVVALSLAGGGVAFAQGETETTTRTEHINIVDALEVTGDVLRPSGDLFVGREGAEFGRLFHVRRSFVNEIIESAEDVALQ